MSHYICLDNPYSHDKTSVEQTITKFAFYAAVSFLQSLELIHIGFSSFDCISYVLHHWQSQSLLENSSETVQYCMPLSLVFRSIERDWCFI